MKTKMEVKIYSVKFIEYTNASNTTVSDDVGRYITIPNPNEPLLIREDEIPFYSKFGKGIRELQFVGYLYVDCLIKDNEVDDLYEKSIAALARHSDQGSEES